MTKKDYILIATAINREYRYRSDDSDCRNGVVGVAHVLADALGDENPRFDKTRFLEACFKQ